MNTPRSNTLKWLVKREFWEHKGGFFWAPAIVGAIMLAFLAASIIVGIALGRGHGFEVNGEHVASLSRAMTPTEKADLAIGLASGYMGLAAPLYIVLSVTVFFFSLGALYDDRKDRSVLFWKSLPISDSATVLSKAGMALVAAPLVTLALGTVVSLLSLLVVCIGSAAVGINVFGQILTTPDLYLSPFQMAAILPVYALWALPTIGWLMMVSAWARTKPFLWAVGVPVVTGTLLSWFKAMFQFDWNIGWFWQYVVGRGLLSVIPGSWFANHPPTLVEASTSMAVQSIHDQQTNFGVLLRQSWTMLGTADLWIGVAVGAAMLYAAIRLRRWRDEG